MSDKPAVDNTLSRDAASRCGHARLSVGLRSYEARLRSEWGRRAQVKFPSS